MNKTQQIPSFRYIVSLLLLHKGYVDSKIVSWKELMNEVAKLGLKFTCNERELHLTLSWLERRGLAKQSNKDPRYYSLHPGLSQFIREELEIEKIEERTKALMEHAHLNYTRIVAYGILHHLGGDSRSSVRRGMLWCDFEIQTIVAAADRALALHHPSYITLLRVIEVYYIRKEKYDNLFNLVTQMLKRWENDRDNLTVAYPIAFSLLNDIRGRVLMRLGDEIAGIKAFKLAIRHAPEEFEAWVQDIKYNMAEALERSFFPEEAMAILKELESWYTDHEEEQSLLAVWIRLGIVHFSSNLFEDSLIYFNKAIHSSKNRAKYEANWVSAMMGLSATLMRLQKYEDANEVCLELTKFLGDTNNLQTTGGGQALNNLGMTFFYLKQFGQAKKNFYEAMSIFIELNVPSEIANVYHNLGNNAFGQSLWDEAEDYFRKALALLTTPAKRGDLLYNLAEVEEAKNNFSSGIQILESALGEYKKASGSLSLQVSVYFSIGRLYGLLKLPQSAIASYRQAMKIVKDEQTKSKLWEFMAFEYHEKGDFGEVKRCLSEAFQCLYPNADQPSFGHLLYNIGQFLKSQPEDDLARQLAHSIGMDSESFLAKVWEAYSTHESRS